ncbi:MAG: (Fe-S)-binding protein [Thermoplasmata archaeon]|nr:MAG: (Fe-S)-binding protein [Thermoplasmata archaeon]
MLEGIIEKSKAYYCVECRKCSSICPITRIYGKFSPASIVERSLIGIEEEVLNSMDIWKCLGCGLCEEVCPSGVEFLHFMREVRNGARKQGNEGIPTHEGVFESIPKLMLEKNIDMDWLDNVETDEKSDIIYFAGCLPFFDIMFKEIGFDGKCIAESTVKLLNKYGVKPSIIYGCCGHDALWNGNVELFNELMNKNMQMLKERKAKKIIFSCPECYRTFKMDYPSMDVELMHISEFLADKDMKGGEAGKEYTFHDSCRLGRHLGIYEEPRNVLKKVGIKVKEMEHNKELAVCCGTSAWMSCDWKSEEIRKERLKEAKKVADVMITSCPKCQIHFKCTLSHENYGIEVKDFVEVVAEMIK